KFEFPKVADKVRLDTPLNHSAAAFDFLEVDAIAAAALCAADSGSIANLGFRVFGHGRLNALDTIDLHFWSCLIVAFPDGLCPALQGRPSKVRHSRHGGRTRGRDAARHHNLACARTRRSRAVYLQGPSRVLLRAVALAWQGSWVRIPPSPPETQR